MASSDGIVTGWGGEARAAPVQRRKRQPVVVIFGIAGIPWQAPCKERGQRLESQTAGWDHAILEDTSEII